MKSAVRPLVVALLLVLAGIGAWQGLKREDRPVAGDLDLSGLLLDSVDGFEQPSQDWTPELPRDIGAHLGFRSELWSVKGHLKDETGRAFAFQLRFVRLALRGQAPDRASKWAANQVYGAQFAWTDPSAGTFQPVERVSRAALGLSGAADDPVRVWVEDWSISALGDRGLLLSVATDDASLDLELRATKPVIDRDDLIPTGVGADTGVGFHFLVLPRLTLTGSLRIEDRVRTVQGHAWLDRVWGEVPAPRGQTALDRFSLHLDDGRDLLCLRLRRRGGGGTPVPTCLLIGSEGQVQSFRRRDIRLDPETFWRSGESGAEYPIGWRLGLPRLGLELRLRALVQDQETGFPFLVWNGAVGVEGLGPGEALSGRGFVELTGYADGS